MSAKHCGHHRGHHHDERYKLNRRILCGIIVFIVLVLFVIFLVWAILHPTKPRFILQDATVYAFNVSTSPPFTISTSMQVTVSSRNRMDRVGIYYQKLDIYATYRSQQVTLQTLLPPTYQGHKEVSVWSPFLYGNSVPMWPRLMGALQQDQNIGSVLFKIKIDGTIKWKVGTWFSGRYHLHVNCPAYIKFGDRNNGFPVGPVMKFQLVQGCNVDV
ncbi:NDR1/HIN1-like protein 1 [Juglans microcarpa x Juglans regia]|uniref:NDR1/HIN1-like protein 1 n=1 Tax=Juglans microcarpa x Juglans regia TaxID=2249226 RepID=UPI001B7E67E9|nr:NDR1/HIN1-like protein 1 [Juglans microcarpa x Juglans regia]